MKKIKITFDQFFEDIYGERWESLKKSILSDHLKVMRRSFSHVESDLPWLPNCLVYNTENQNKRTERNDLNLLQYYIMDPASIMVANSLDIKAGDRILDMCSAPGGKGLILAEKIGTTGEIILNEISKNRRERLTKVVRDYIPIEVRGNVHVKGKDGIRYGITEPDSFDAILVDAPCSGERHLLLDTDELLKWGPKRTKRLSSIQYGLLCSALLALKVNGQIVYSTCTISPVENDQVIEKLLSKKGNMVELDLPRFSDSFPVEYIEKTEFGYIFMPDKCGFGPLFLSRLKKVHHG